MPSALPKLPVEVIEKIASTLDRTSLYSFRLTCKEIDRKTLHGFGHTCFAMVQTDLSHNSLQKLQSISQTEHLKHHVQTLLIREKYDRGDEMGQGLHWHRLGNSPGKIVNHISPGVQMLRDVLTKLAECKSYYIYSLGDYHINRLREGEGLYGSDYLTGSDVTAIILGIIAETSLPVKSFRVDYKDPVDVNAFDVGVVDANRLQMHLYQQPAFLAAWDNLEDLHLAFHLQSDIVFDWARNLVLHTTRLKKLSLHFGYIMAVSFIRSLLSSPTVLQGLQEFKLGCINLTLEILLSLLLQCRSNLRRLSLSCIHIRSGNWVQLLTELKKFSLLEAIAIEWPKWSGDEVLEYLHFPALYDNPVVPHSGGRKFELIYNKPEENATKAIWGARFHGWEGMNKALEVLAESMVPISEQWRR